MKAPKDEIFHEINDHLLDSSAEEASDNENQNCCTRIY